MVGSRRVGAGVALAALLLSACSFSASLSPAPSSATPAAPTPRSRPATPVPSVTPAEPTEISFPAGGSAAAVRGTADLGTHVRWSFSARAGQRARLSTAAAGGGVGFGLTSPRGAVLQRAGTDVRQGTYRLPETGRYEVTIASASAGTPYVLTVAIPALRRGP